MASSFQIPTGAPLNLAVEMLDPIGAMFFREAHASQPPWAERRP